MTLEEAIKIIFRLELHVSSSSYDALTYVRHRANKVTYKDICEIWKWEKTPVSSAFILKEYGTYANCIDWEVELNDETQELELTVIAWRGDSFDGRRIYPEYEFKIILEEIPVFIADAINYAKSKKLGKMYEDHLEDIAIKWMNKKFKEIMKD